jgi:hypothetical protein
MSHPVNLLIRTLETSAGRPKARSRVKPIADVERAAAILPELMRVLEWRLASLGSCIDALDAALANGAFAHPRSPAAINLASAERTLDALVDKIVQQRAALIERS